MSCELDYFDTGEKIFRPGEAIYVNRCIEQAESHLHAHDFIEIAYVASGIGVHRLGDVEYAVSKGDLFIINYQIHHEFRSLPEALEQPLQVYNCIFKPEFIDCSLLNCRDFSRVAHHFLFHSLFPEEYTSGSDIMLLNCNSREIGELYEKMFKEYNLRDTGYLEMLRAYVVELFVTISRLYRSSGAAETGIEKQRRDIIEKAIGYLKSNYSQGVKLEDLSMMSFLSRNYFCRLFKQHTGMTVYEYIQRVRMEEACRLLRETGKKVTDIAADVGYSDIKYFNTVFKRQTGKTPGQYRKY